MRTRHPKVKINCLNCGIEKLVWQSRIDMGKGKFCSTRCGKVGKHNPQFIDGRKHGDGYIKVLAPTHPNKDLSGYVPEHRFIMEQHIGRYLTEDEVIHHKNGKRDDNRIENLQLCANQAEHMKIHRHLGDMPRFTSAKVLAI